MGFRSGDEEGHNSLGFRSGDEGGHKTDPSYVPLTQLMEAISCVGRGIILLENNSTLSECCINPRNQLVLQQVQIPILIHLNPLFNEDEISEVTVRASCSQVLDRLRRVVKAKGYIEN